MTLASAVGRAIESLKAIAGVQTTYCRGTDRLGIRAVKTDVAVEVDRGDGVTIEARRTDWIIQSEDLVFDGRTVRPAEGDRIEHWMGTTKNSYEVMPLGTASHCRPVGPYGNAWRVHSKLVKTEP